VELVIYYFNKGIFLADLDKDKLTAFYNSDYKPFIKDTDLDYTHLNTVLDYLTIGIITMYKNNIKLHYVEYIERYVNIVWKKKDTITKIKEENKDEEKQKELVNEFCRQLRKVKNDILEQVICVQFVKMKQEAVKNSK